MVNVSILTDNDTRHGLGNFIRSYALYKILKDKKSLSVKHFLYKNLKTVSKTDILIIDLPQKHYSIKKIKRYFTGKSQKKISLDHTQKWHVDLNISIFNKSSYAKKNIVSLKNIIIRENLKKRKKIKKGLFYICIGSRDLKNSKNKIFNSFTKFYKDIKISQNINIKKVKERVKQKKHEEFISQCNLAASNGGTTMLELLYHRKVIFVYPQNIQEKKFSIFLKKKGYKIFINKYQITSKFLKSIRNIKQKKGIDHRGLIRISKIITKF